MNLLDLIFPKHCVGCGKIGAYFCDRCRTIIKVVASNEAICPVCEKLAVDGVTHPRCRTRYTPDGLTSVFRYNGVVRKAVKQLKYRFVSDLTREFVSLIPPLDFDHATMKPWNHGILVPVPLHPSRQKERGFNQAEILGRFMAEQLQIPMAVDILRRTKKTTPQVGTKDKKARLANMDRAFSVNHVTIQPYNHVVLFDDVFTTGATMRAAANILKRSEIKRVWCVTMAR